MTELNRRETESVFGCGRLYFSRAGRRRRLRTNAAPRFRQLRRQRVRLSKPACDAWFQRPIRRLGVLCVPGQQLASDHLAFPFARLPALRAASSPRAPLDQRSAARRSFGPTVLGISADDRRSLAQRFRRGRLRHPSAAGGIGRLGRRTKRHSLRLVFHLTLWAYLGYVRHPFSLARYLLVAALFALGLMSKPMLVTLPFVLLLLDYWPLGRWSGGFATSWGGSCTATPEGEIRDGNATATPTYRPLGRWSGLGNNRLNESSLQLPWRRWSSRSFRFSRWRPYLA